MRSFVLLLCLGIAGRAGATAYSVSPTGNDAGAGPWKTLQYAADHVAMGDVVTVENGTYAGFVMDGKSGLSTKRIVFQAKNRGNVHITSASATNNDFPDDWVVLTSSSFITLDGFDVSGAARAGISVLGNEDDGSDATDDVVMFCHSYNNGGGSSAGRHDGIFTGFARNVHIHDNHVHDNSEHGIYVSNAADGPIIERNDVHDNTSNGIQINADESTGGDGVITGWRISQNKVHGNTGAAAINLDGASNGVLVNNLLYANTKGGITLFQGDGAVASSGNLIANNTVYNPSGSRAAIQVADGANNNVLFNNIFYSNNVGLEVQTVTGLVHDYNLISSYDGATKSAHESAPAATTIFASVGGNDYQLGTGSAALNGGIATLGGKTAPTNDLLDGARPVGVIDVGCYESGASMTTDAAVAPTDMAMPSGDLAIDPDAPDLAKPDLRSGGTSSNDGSAPQPDGSMADSGTTKAADNGGCACGTTPGDYGDALFGIAALLGLAIARGRSTRAARPT